MVRRSSSIAAKLGVVLVLLAAGFAVVSVLASLRADARIMTERRDATRAVVETALGVVEHFGREADAGRMTTAAAQEAAIAAVRELRYSGEEYFWINDMTPTMVMHPMKPELDGTDLSTNADPDGTLLF